ncbi:hypothetical protein C8J57DRAFT_1213683 [Mycena rebaudengoi]|nr:hypothetical protein C8J57DRAFT_1213683 [Mycena rebaudengoi]
MPNLPLSNLRPDKKSTDLTELAKNGKLDSKIGSDEVLSNRHLYAHSQRRSHIEIRRTYKFFPTKRNPIPWCVFFCLPSTMGIIPKLIGPPGVGKTAILEGLASRIVRKEVSELTNFQLKHSQQSVPGNKPIVTSLRHEKGYIQDPFNKNETTRCTILSLNYDLNFKFDYITTTQSIKVPIGSYRGTTTAILLIDGHAADRPKLNPE